MVQIKKISDLVWKIEKTGKMNVPVTIFASEKLLEKIKEDKTLEQAQNMAMMPGVVGQVVVLPDAHQGYGACIGGVSAYDIKKGVVSPGQVGYDIMCGVRLLATNLTGKEFVKKEEQVLSELYKNIPSGVGRGGEFKLSDKELNEAIEKGSSWALEKGYATKEDIEHTEDSGKIFGANAGKVSQKAKGRGKNQLGTIGAGNHFLEVQEVEEIFDEQIAKIFNLEKGQIVVMIHTGSRGLGHQTASDYIQKMEAEYGFKNLPDRELACAPIESQLGKDYVAAMAAAANFAFLNRQLITYQIRKSFEKYFSKCEVKVIYDIAHNIAKFEEFFIEGKKQILCVHRKGATRSFGPGRKEVPVRYQKVGCPIFIPGSMGTSSYVLVGTKKAEEVSFASTAHGAGRVLSRTFAKNNITVEQVKKQLKERGVIIRAGSVKGLLEEAPQAYKDVDEVARVSHELGIGNLVAKLKPMAVVKG